MVIKIEILPSFGFKGISNAKPFNIFSLKNLTFEKKIGEHKKVLNQYLQFYAKSQFQEIMNAFLF